MATYKKKAQKLKATIAFQDESGVMMNPLVRRTWAPRGQTPILHRRGRSYEKVTVMGALCAKPGQSRKKPKLYFRILRHRNANAVACVAFLTQLAANLRGPIFILWDQLRAHQSKLVRKFLLKHPRMSLHYFPAYAPELNPIELAWGYLKRNELANYAPLHEIDLFKAAKRGICRTRRKGPLLASFIRHTGLPFFD